MIAMYKAHASISVFDPIHDGGLPRAAATIRPSLSKMTKAQPAPVVQGFPQLSHDPSVYTVPVIRLDAGRMSQENVPVVDWILTSLLLR